MNYSFNLEIIKESLKKRGFHSVVCDNLNEALQYINETFSVNNNMIIGMGNSLTLEALGIKKLWEKQALAIYQHTPDSTESETKKALIADIYLTSAK